MTFAAVPAGEFVPCALVPTYDNPRTVAAVVRNCLEHVGHAIVVDDGSGEATRESLREVESDPRVTVLRRSRNCGKGAALKAGFRVATIMGFTHALQVDADGQHDVARMPEFLDAARTNPLALVLGYPVYDESVPRSRLVGRRVARWWVDLEVGRGRVLDPMVGFRVYPLPTAVIARPVGDRMQADIEIVVRMAWLGVPLVNLPVGVRYLSPEDGGVSHFRMLEDNVSISWMHTRLVARWIARTLTGRRSRLQ